MNNITMLTTTQSETHCASLSFVTCEVDYTDLTHKKGRCGHKTTKLINLR